MAAWHCEVCSREPERRKSLWPLASSAVLKLRSVHRMAAWHCEVCSREPECRKSLWPLASSAVLKLRSVAGRSQSRAQTRSTAVHPRLGKHCPLFSQAHGLGNTAHFFLKLRAHEEEYGKSAHGAATQSLSGPRSLRNQIGSFLFPLFHSRYPCLVLFCLSLESSAYGLAGDPKLLFLERTVTKIKNSILIKLQHYLAPKSQTLSVKRTRSKVFVRPDMQRSGIHKKFRTVMEVDTPQLIRRQSIDSRRVGHFLDLGSLLISNHSGTPAICLYDL